MAANEARSPVYCLPTSSNSTTAAWTACSTSAGTPRCSAAEMTRLTETMLGMCRVAARGSFAVATLKICHASLESI